MYNRKSYGLYGSKTMMFSPDNTELSGAVVDSSRSGSSVLEYNNEGYFFRGQYDYDNRIYFSGSYRRDASSRSTPTTAGATSGRSAQLDHQPRELVQRFVGQHAEGQSIVRFAG